MVSKKTYLGDAVYADINEFGIELTTENGIEVANTIFLEPEVIQSLIDYLARYEFRRD